jgi:S1-C subfamily serine protease
VARFELGASALRPVIAALVPVVVLGLATSCAGPAANASRARLSAKDIVKASTPAIVRIEAGDRVGTGFILDPSGLVATNLHVVAGLATIKVRLLDGTTYPVLRIAGVDANRDLAVLDIDPKAPLPVLHLGDSDALVAGDQVTAIGNPLGFLDYSVSAGLVSSVRVVAPELTVLQISVPISQGSSGGPLFNQFGEVIGVTTAIITAGQNLNLAVPGNYLKPLLAHPIALALDEFARKTTEHPDDGPPPDGATPRIVRKVPMHQVAFLDGCNRQDIAEVVRTIGEAIASGAPLYNQGNHEACYRIYEGTAEKWEREAPCPGIRTAFGDGLLRASALTSFTEKAWAMRDTFDGLIDVAARWSQSHP